MQEFVLLEYSLHQN